jgi:hypothetical protein
MLGSIFFVGPDTGHYTSKVPVSTAESSSISLYVTNCPTAIYQRSMSLQPFSGYVIFQDMMARTGVFEHFVWLRRKVVVILVAGKGIISTLS